MGYLLLAEDFVDLFFVNFERELLILAALFL